MSDYMDEAHQAKEKFDEGILYEGPELTLSTGPTDVDIRMQALHCATQFQGKMGGLLWFHVKQFEHYIKHGEMPQ